jgi:hypothetical protein
VTFEESCLGSAMEVKARLEWSRIQWQCGARDNPSASFHYKRKQRL